MTNMVERVARAIIEGLESVSVHVSTMGGDTGHCLADGVLFNMADVAEHVIKAMSDPNQDMILAGVMALSNSGVDEANLNDASECFAAMIDAALTTKIEE